MEFEMTVDKTGLLALSGANKVIGEELRDLIHSGALFAEREIKRNAPQGVGGTQGGLRGGIFSEMRGTELQPIGIVASPSEHSEVMENGRRPGQRMPPPEALETWVEKKLDVFGFDHEATLKGKDRTAAHKANPYRRSKKMSEGEVAGVNDLRAKRVREISWLVARSIGKKGIAATHFFSKGVKATEEHMRKAFSDMGLKIKYRLEKRP